MSARKRHSGAETYGEEEVDNADIDEYGPHVWYGDDYWKIGDLAWWDIPWIQRPLIGQLVLDDGTSIDLREGDLPNRNPYNPDPSLFAKKDFWHNFTVSIQKRDRSSLLDAPEDDYDTWVATFDKMLDRKIRWERKTPQASDTNATERQLLTKLTLLTAKMDWIVNYSGTVPMPEPVRLREGEFEDITPYMPDEVDAVLDDLSVDEMHKMLWEFSKFGRVKSIATLCEAGADPNAVNEFSCTAMHYAAREGWSPTIEVLYKFGGDLNVKNEIEMTPLHYAAYNNRTAAVWALLRCGAEISVRNYFNFTALELASIHNFKQIVSLLESWGNEGAMNQWEQRYGDMFRRSHDPVNFNPLIRYEDEGDSAEARKAKEAEGERVVYESEESKEQSSEQLLGDTGSSGSSYDENTTYGLLTQTLKEMNERD
ncbi:hypothetical protein GUITHDRAFT_137577 [Guillardia theta CCMP2712]|uniref:Uncharacterized protein n=1 Tax=Guillardia theta (strain CCMP2712) TaxID=905079 RepID=L1JGZ1_GUITC|nr:hypothetical protein GUITHDRAFT_137577 [Guillardia theta CCMP2712]EKX47409.1 hypothetical protein GUITHDRAFT_137577 [Guillardia theta CCMP2712]|eukprot:XP_005834389.1 hypothetical protein GUITHDRAFT_137577 [Guillardia theta CCMP2712]